MADFDVQPVRFSRLKHFPQSSSAVEEKFLSLFHRYGYIYKPFGSRGWLSADERWKLTDTEILKAIACVHPKYLLGTRAAKASYYAVIDIDAGSKYHNLDSLKKITRVLAEAGIEETNLYRSSESGGWHLYIWFDAPVSCRDLRAQLFQLFDLHDFEINKGTLEIFPHVGEKSLGQGLRLPLQEGFAWLNQDNLTIRHDRLFMSPVEALTQFMDDFECSANPYHNFHKLKAHVATVAAKREQIVARTANATKLAEVVPIRNFVYSGDSEEAMAVVKSVFRTVPPNIIADNWLKGRNYYAVGLTAPNQRADATTSLSHYLFFGDPERLLPAMGYGYEDERNWVIQEVLTTKHNGYSEDLRRGRSDALAQAERASHWIPPRRRGQENQKYKFEMPISWVRNNANRAALACRKIEAAVADFEEAGLPFSMRDLRLKSGCSSTTLAKHEELWKPVQERLSNVRLAGDPHEYNAVEGAACLESKPLTQVEQKIVAPGRLAARRVVYELKMRDERAEKNRNRDRLAWQQGQEGAWRRRLVEITPDDFGECSQGELRDILAVYLSALPNSPAEESEEWLRELIGELRARLDLRFDQRRLPHSE